MKINKKSSAVTLLLLIASVSVLSMPSISMSNKPQSAEVTSSSSSRTITFEFYNFFDPGDAAMKQDVWERREWYYGEDNVIRYTYPVVYEWYYDPPSEHVYYYTSSRLNVAARELPEIHIDDPEFLPYNLMGGLPSGVEGGTASLSNWYLDYVNETKARELGIYPGAEWDAWQNELRGDIIMDKNATMKILGITEAQYNDFNNWWTTYEADVELRWEEWLYYEGNERLKIFPFIGDWYLDFGDGASPAPKFWWLFDFQLKDFSPLVGVTLSFDTVSWGMECLLARWFWETFMPGYEYYYDDLKFNATIGPDTTDLDLDTACHWIMYMWSYNDTAFADAVWSFEPQSGDLPMAAYPDYPDSPAYPYYVGPKTYYYVAPGHDWYDTFGEYDYTPESFELKEGETLIVRWGDTWTKGQIWGYKQEPWGPTQTPRDTIVQVTGVLRLSDSSEPYPWWGEFPGNVVYDPMAGTLTYSGPFNMTQLSLVNMPEEWARLADPQHPQGLLPWGEPYVELKIRIVADIDFDGDVDQDDFVLFGGYYPTSVVDPESAKADLDFDGDVDQDDFVIFGGYYPTS